MSKFLTIGLVLDDTLDRSDGVQQAVLTIGNELQSRGHRVHYIVAKTTRTDILNVHSIGKFLKLKFNGNSVRTPMYSSHRQVKELFEDIRFDILHVQMPYSPLLAEKVLKLAPLGVKKFGTFHILPYNSMTKLGTKLLGFAVHRTVIKLNAAFAVSEPALEFMSEAFGIKGTIIPNPVNYSYYNGQNKSKLAKKLIVFVGRFEERKGVLELIQAYSELPPSIRDQTQLVMCGKGPYFEKAQVLAEKLNVSIDFPGFVTDAQKRQFLTDADIAVFPSKSGESFGIVLVESMSAGSGITIGGNNPGYASVLSAWPDSLFDPTNTNEFSSKLLTLLTNEKLRKKIGRDQHESVLKFDVKRVTDKLLEFYYKS